MLGCGHLICSDCSIKKKVEVPDKQGDGVETVIICNDCMIENPYDRINRSIALKVIALNYLLSKKIVETLTKLAS